MADSLMSSLQCHPPVLVEHEYSNKTDNSAARLKNGVNTCFHISNRAWIPFDAYTK